MGYEFVPEAYPRNRLAGNIDNFVELDIGYHWIIDANDQARDLCRKFATVSIFGIEVARNETSTREVDHKRQWFVGCGLLYPHIELSMLDVCLFVPFDRISNSLQTIGPMKGDGSHILTFSSSGSLGHCFVNAANTASYVGTSTLQSPVITYQRPNASSSCQYVSELERNEGGVSSSWAFCSLVRTYRQPFGTIAFTRPLFIAFRCHDS